MKPTMPHILRRGAAIRVASPGDAVRAGAPASAVAFVDLRFDDGHVERWRGSGSIRDEDLVPYSSLLGWGAEVADEHLMTCDLGMALSDLDRQALREAPVEIVIEWNAELPRLD